MNRFFTLVTAALMAVFFANNSIADNEGISIGFWGTQLDVDVYGTETQDTSTTGGNAGDVDVVSAIKNSSHDVGSIFIEFTAAQGSSIGIEYYPGEATLGTGSRTDTCMCGADAGAAGGATSATYTARADVTDIWTVYMEPTYMFNETFGFYGKVGATTLYLKSLEVLTGNGDDDTTYPNEDLWGLMYGLGVKARHPSGLFMKLEGITTNFQHLELGGTGGNSPSIIDADIDMESVRLAVGYTF